MRSLTSKQLAVLALAAGAAMGAPAVPSRPDTRLRTQIPLPSNDPKPNPPRPERIPRTQADLDALAAAEAKRKRRAEKRNG